GRDTLVLLVLSDFDPDGEGIAESFARSMRDDFGIGSIEPVKVALTHDQVHQHGLQPDMQAKKKSSRYKKFAARYGDDVFELEALAPSALQQILRESIDSVLDIDAFNRELAQEKQDAAYLDGVRRTVNSTLRQLHLEGQP